MKYLLSKKEMQDCDRRTIEFFGVPSMVLMERAALACVSELEKAGVSLKNVLVVCGSGNNGGDGLAIARMLFERGIEPAIWFVGNPEHKTEQCRLQYEICERYGLKFCANPDLSEYTVIVDAIFGVGLKRTVEGRYRQVIEAVNQTDAFVLSVDIASGLDADTGNVLGISIKADLTVTFAFEKPGHYLCMGREYTGRLICAQIGITPFSLADTTATCYRYEKGEDDHRLPVRPKTANKGTCGKVLLIAGRPGMCGAAILAGRGAIRSGAGLVRIYTDSCNLLVIQQALPEAMVTVYEPERYTEQLEELFLWADACGMGPGLGLSEDKAEIVEYTLRNLRKPLVLDADGLNIVSKHPAWRNEYKGNLLITPHPGELGRLSGKTIKELLADPKKAAKETADRFQGVCVLKDAGTVVTDGRECYINSSGNCGMACGGSGDVLTGIVSALLAEGMPSFEAAKLGVWIHGRAGDLAAEKLGVRSMKSGDIAEQLSDVFLEMYKEKNHE